MNLTVHGAGYVGLVSAACFAEMGNFVLCCDIDVKKIAELENGKCPIHEPGLEALILKNYKAGNLQFTTKIANAVEHGDVQFIAVGTPSDEDGSADLSHVLAVARNIGRFMQRKVIVVNKSTVPVGTATQVEQTIEAVLHERNVSFDFSVLSNPEFLKEGAAIQDFLRPDRIIVGGSDPDAIDVLKRLYHPFNRNHERFFIMDAPSAELTKYAANAMLATRISFMNVISQLAEKLGADIEHVRLGIGSDTRIGYHYTYAGCGYGGSCFPKDVRALQKMAEHSGCDISLLKATEEVNLGQKRHLISKIKHHFSSIENKVFALWGLAFKPNTDDMREAPSRVIIDELLASGARIQAFDPEALKEASRIYHKQAGIVFCDDMEHALEGADALIIVTEWNAFKSPDFSIIKNSLKTPVIFDGRNIYDPELMKQLGIIYYGIGRQVFIPKDIRELHGKIKLNA